MKTSLLVRWGEVSTAIVKQLELVKFPSFPSTVDFNIVGRCNLNCTWCWGPSHDAKETVSLAQWKMVLNTLHEHGTKNLVISGGEPLLKRWLGELANYAKFDMGMRVTLSTNGILLKQKAASVLPYIHDLGIPLDGHTHEVNKVMRVGKYKHYDYALEGLRYAQQHYPDIDLTMRTVIAAPNLDSVPLIGKTILAHGIDPNRLRWKLYQVNPIGPRVDDIKKGDWLISAQKFNEVVDETRELNPNFNIVAQPVTASAGRYFIIFPDGNAHVIDEKSEEKNMGNIVQDTGKVIDALKNTEHLAKNHSHGINKKHALNHPIDSSDEDESDGQPKIQLKYGRH